MRRVLGLAVVVLAATSCAIQADQAPRDIPQSEQPPLEAVSSGAGEGKGSSRVFLLTRADDSGGRHLRSVLRDVGPTPKLVLEELFKGPNQEELNDGLRTALPEGLVLHSAQSFAGTLVVDVSSELLELPGSALRLAVAEIVFTASELEGVRAVRLKVDNEQRSWPDGRGELQTSILTVYDYPGLAESTQPPYPAVPSPPAP